MQFPVVVRGQKGYFVVDPETKEKIAWADSLNTAHSIRSFVKQLILESRRENKTLEEVA